MPTEKHALMDPKSGFFQGIVQQTKLILRLISDKNVSFFLKVLPIASAIYVLSPVDLAPGLALPIIGALDDAAVLWLGTTLFISLCPDEIVQKHKEALEKVLHGTWKNGKADENASTEIIDVKASEAPLKEE